MAARSEGVIETSEGEVRVLYTNFALAQVEKETGKSIIAFSEGFANGQTGIRDIAIALKAGMEAQRRSAQSGGRVVSLRDAFNALDDVGFGVVAATVMTAIAEVLGYGQMDDDEGDLDPNV